MKFFSFLFCAVLFVIALPNVNAQERLPGDLDGNGSVDFADFVIFAENYGKTGGVTFDPTRWVDTVRIVKIDTLILHNTVVVRDTLWREQERLMPTITVEPGNWEASTNMIQAVCISVRNALSNSLVYALDSDIVVQHREPEGPKILYTRYFNGSHIIWLDSERMQWAQQIFQFAHEYTHMLHNYRFDSPHKWFGESLASLGSIYTLRYLDKEGRYHSKVFLGIDHWFVELFVKYATDGYLRVYWQNITRSIPKYSPDLFRLWYQQNRQQLEANPYLRKNNKIVALHLLDIFENNPEAWNAVRYLNRGPLVYNQSFADYLKWWYLRTPTRWQWVVSEIAKRFGVTRYYKQVVTTEGEDTRPLYSPHLPHSPNKGRDGVIAEMQ